MYSVGDRTFNQSWADVHVFMLSFRCRNSNRQTHGDSYCDSDNAHQCHQNPWSKAENSIIACTGSLLVCNPFFAERRKSVFVYHRVISGGFQTLLSSDDFRISIPSRDFEMRSVVQKRRAVGRWCRWKQIGSRHPLRS